MIGTRSCLSRGSNWQTALEGWPRLTSRSLSGLLEAMVQGYDGAITHHRPEEILTG